MTRPRTGRAVVRTAHPSEARTVTGTVVAAYNELGLYHWLAPHAQRRSGVLTGYFRILITHALAHGSVEVIDGERGPLAVAGWLPSTAPAGPPDFAEQLTTVTGRWSAQFLALHAHLARVRAYGHRRLVVLAVLPRAQGQGLGNRLLTHHLAHLDERGISAAVEAASTGSVDLYARHGFTPGNPFAVAAEPGCVLTPMRRPPRPPDGVTASRATVPAARAAALGS